MSTNLRSSEVDPLARPVVESPGLSLFELTMGATITQVLAVAADLRIADRIHAGQRTITALADEIGWDALALERVVRVLERLGVVERDAAGGYDLTRFGDPLRADAVPTIRPWALMAAAPWYWGALGQLQAVFEEDMSGFVLEHGVDVFELLNQPGNEVAKATYAHAMGGVITTEVDEIAVAFDFSDARTIVDVGGGTGALCQALLRGHAHLTGTVFDQPEVTQLGVEQLAPDVGQRCRFVAGNFFDSVPCGGDVVFLSRILHDWNDCDAERILRTIRRSVSPDSTLLIVEQLITDDDPRPFTSLCDMNMAVLYNAAERTPDEMRCLLERAGFALERSTRLASGRYLIEAHPVARSGAPS